MAIDLHPSAARNFNAKASALVDLISEMPPPKRAADAGFASDMPVQATISDEDVIGEVEQSDVDYQGNTVARYFWRNETRFGVAESNFRSLKDLAEQVQMTDGVREKLGPEFVEKTLFSWLRFRFENSDWKPEFSEYLDQCAREVVKDLRVWVPVSNLLVEHSFPVARSSVIPLSADLVAGWEAIGGPASDETKSDRDALFNEIRNMYQGSAAIETVVSAEPNHAIAYSIDQANLVTALLSVFSRAVMIPDVKSVTAPKGAENISQSTAIVVPEDQSSFQMNQSIIDKASAKYWTMDRAFIDEIRQAGLNTLSEIAVTPKRTDFQNTVFDAIKVYSRAAFSSDPSDKLIYILAALESALLKSDSEPIQQNLAERLAFLIAGDVDGRRSVVGIVKTIYGARSRYLHHGRKSADIDNIAEFMGCALQGVTCLIQNSCKFRTKADFLEAVDNLRLS